MKALCLGALVCLMATAASAQSDTTPPTITSVTASTTTVTAGPQSVDVYFDVGFTDDLSGAWLLDILLESPSGGASTLTAAANSDNHGDLISGTTLKGVLRAVVTFPAYVPTGNWTVARIRLRDHAGNMAILITNDIAARGFPQKITVMTGTQTPPPPPPPPPAPSVSRAGSFAQVASGGGWKTTITLINSGAVAVTGRVNFYTEGGNALVLPLTFPQTGSNLTSSFANLNIAPNGLLVLETENPNSSTAVVGWADVQASAALTGYSIFRLRSSAGATDSEGTGPLDVQSTSSLIIPFDNTNGFTTGLALANQNTAAATITITVLDDNGLQLASRPIALGGQAHVSYFVGDTFSQSVNRRGILQVRNALGITAVGLRFNPSGSFTSIPIIRPSN